MVCIIELNDILFKKFNTCNWKGPTRAWNGAPDSLGVGYSGEDGNNIGASDKKKRVESFANKNR